MRSPVHVVKKLLRAGEVLRPIEIPMELRPQLLLQLKPNLAVGKNTATPACERRHTFATIFRLCSFPFAVSGVAQDPSYAGIKAEADGGASSPEVAVARRGQGLQVATNSDATLFRHVSSHWSLVSLTAYLSASRIISQSCNHTTYISHNALRGRFVGLPPLSDQSQISMTFLMRFAQSYSEPLLPRVFYQSSTPRCTPPSPASPPGWDGC